MVGNIQNYELLKEKSEWQPSKYFLCPGYKIFLFHPIHIFLNSSSMKEYNDYKDDKSIFFNNLVDKFLEVSLQRTEDKLMNKNK